MTSETLQFGRERTVRHIITGLLQMIVGSAVLTAMLMGFGPEDDMQVVFKILGAVFIFAGFHKILHYRVVRVFPSQKKLQIGYRWYFWNSLRDAPIDEFASIRIIKNHLSSSEKTRRVLLMLTNTKFDCDELVVEDYSFDLILERGKKLARATELPLFIEDARSEKKEEVQL